MVVLILVLTIGLVQVLCYVFMAKDNQWILSLARSYIILLLAFGRADVFLAAYI